MSCSLYEHDIDDDVHLLATAVAIIGVCAGRWGPAEWRTGRIDRGENRWRGDEGKGLFV